MPNSTQSERGPMLARIRAGLAKNGAMFAAEAAAAPHNAPPYVHPPETDLAAQFASELTKLQAHPHRAIDEEEAVEIVQQILRAKGASDVLAWDLAQIGLPGLGAMLASDGVTVQTIDPPHDVAARVAHYEALEPVQVCISGADIAIAESATLVVRGGPGRPRLASLLAPTYIAIVPERLLVRGLGEALAKLRMTHGAQLLDDAFGLTLITGPSRTADIEMTLTLGVHGPREVHVVIVGGVV